MKTNPGMHTLCTAADPPQRGCVPLALRFVVLSVKTSDEKLRYLRACSGAATCDPVTAALQALLSMGLSQARILEWVPIPFSRGSS